jgi:hypothetical protein
MAYLGVNVINLLNQDVAQNVAISLGYFIFSKYHNEPPKVAQLPKITQSGHPGWKLSSQPTVIKNMSFCHFYCHCSI